MVRGSAPRVFDVVCSRSILTMVGKRGPVHAHHAVTLLAQQRPEGLRGRSGRLAWAGSVNDAMRSAAPRPRHRARGSGGSAGPARTRPWTCRTRQTGPRVRGPHRAALGDGALQILALPGLAPLGARVAGEDQHAAAQASRLVLVDEALQRPQVVVEGDHLARLLDGEPLHLVDLVLGGLLDRIARDRRRGVGRDDVRRPVAHDLHLAARDGVAKRGQRLAEFDDLRVSSATSRTAHAGSVSPGSSLPLGHDQSS